MRFEFEPIGVLHSSTKRLDDVPPQCAESVEEGIIEVFEPFADGLLGIEKNKQILVVFVFDRFLGEKASLIQMGRKSSAPRGVFSLCSPHRPNPLGVSVVTLLRVDGRNLYVRNIDMLDGTPILDIKPFVLAARDRCR
ncbi:tRNA (N6-threonylcarbamoyladenosine(37)-N6)-methyltransferase TrmO [bacterium]|nr:tRNA (N6-threonylcarbamoyladenosine(37)-N6)-methyltransferase TrmO [bacterium]